MSAMPKQKPGRSKQDYETPDSLIQAIEKRFHESFVWDLAATQANKKVVSFDHDYPYFGPDHPDTFQRDSLKVDWCRTHVEGLLFLNPPFGNIEPWAAKCYEEMKMGARIMFLTPSSTGANWFQKYCFRKAYVIFIKPRIVFEGETSPYPKDICLTYFHAGIKGQEIWDWKACLEGDRNGPISSPEPITATLIQKPCSDTHKRPNRQIDPKTT